MQAAEQKQYLDFVRAGPGFIAFQPVGGRFFERHFRTHDEALAQIAQHGGGANTWVSMATYWNPNSRKSDNATGLRALWLDVDAHGEGNDNSSPEAARKAVEQFVQTAQLPTPSAFNMTGHGVHALWVLSDSIPRSEWQIAADKLQDLAMRLKLDIDPITGDAARILRVAGTVNFRDPKTPRACELDINIGNAYDFDVLHESLEAALQRAPMLAKQRAAPLLKTAFRDPESPENVQVVQHMLRAIKPDPDYFNWRDLVWAVASTGWKCSYDLARSWSESGSKWEESSFNKVWASFRQKEGGITFGTLVYHARAAGYTGSLLSRPSENFTEAAKSGSAAGRIVTRCAAEIQPEHVEWLVPGSFPLGMLAVIGGQPGLGKSQIAISLAACVTAGTELPGGGRYSGGGSVIVLANEDDAARTIRPRLDAAGADIRKVHIVEGVAREGSGDLDLFQLDQDVADLRALTQQLGDVRLIIIDPPSAYLGSKVDSYKDSDVRRVLMPLSTLAQESGAMILLVVHLNKRNDAGAQQRFSGSTAWTAAPRVGFVVAEDPSSKLRYMVPVKNNVGNDRLGFQYRVVGQTVRIGEQDFPTSRVAWAATTDKPAHELLNPPRVARTSVVNEATDFLREELGAGPVSVNDLRERAKQAGVSWSAVQRAKKPCLVRTEKTADGWRWTMLAIDREGLLDE